MSAKSGINVGRAKASRVNDFVIRLANVNGTGSASANSLLMKTIFRMGVPVMGKNFFPSNIQGLPTWYEIRVTRDRHLARFGRDRHHGGHECRDLPAGSAFPEPGWRAPVRLHLAPGTARSTARM